MIDTNRFKARTGARTFEACATLRTLGVDPNEAEDLIKENIQEFEEKSAIMQNEKVIFNLEAVAKCDSLFIYNSINIYLCQ